MEKLQKIYRVRSAECDRFNQMRLRSLFNLFQDAADLNAENIGFGYSFCLQNNLTWMGAGYHLKINRLPRRDEEFVLSSWPVESTGLTAVRDFELKTIDGEVLLLASSSWILIDLERKRPVSIQKYLDGFVLFKERVFDADLKKILLPEDLPFICYQLVREDDIDINQHVNNAVYPSWILDAIPIDFLTTHDLQELKIQFKQGALKENKIAISSKIEDNTSYTLIYDENTGVECARVLSVWKKKELE